MTNAPTFRTTQIYSSRKLIAAVSAVIAVFASALTQSVARAAEPVIPPFPPGLFFPVDDEKAPTIPGATLVASRPLFDFKGLPGWIHGKEITNSMNVTIPKYEMLVIRGSVIKNNTVIIPPGGLYFDSSPARGELPMTGSSDFFLGKRYYFVDYDARIHVVRNVLVRPKKLTVAGNHLYTMLLPPVPKVVPNPVINWRTFDGVSIRPWAFTQRWEKTTDSQPDQKPMTYLQGVIRKADKKGVFYATLTGTSIHREWWAKTLVFEGLAKTGQQWVQDGNGVRIDRIDPSNSSVSITFFRHGKPVLSKKLVAKNSPTLPENPTLRKKMIAIYGTEAVVLWPHDALQNGAVHLWVYGGVETWTTNHTAFGLSHMAYFPIACPIAHHIGGMIYNTRPLRLSPGTILPVLGGYARIKVVSIQGTAVKFLIETRQGQTPVFSKSGNIDAVIGAGRAAHGILSTLDTTDLNLEKDLTVMK